MKPFRNVLRLNIMRRLLVWLAAQYARLVYLTGSWQVVRGEIPEGFWREGRTFILAFWHGRMLMMPFCWNKKTSIYILMSQHRDGQVAAKIVNEFGIKTIFGSSSKGGAIAFRALIKALKNGSYVGITPDGPRGPRMRASEGIVRVARLSGVPIIPAGISSTNGRHLSTWDKFLVAWPFGRRVLVWGNPIYVEKKTSPKIEEIARQQIEDALNNVTAEADRLAERIFVEPAKPLRGKGGAP